MQVSTRSTGVSLAKGPVWILGALGVAYGVTGLIFGGLHALTGVTAVPPGPGPACCNPTASAVPPSPSVVARVAAPTTRHRRLAQRYTEAPGRRLRRGLVSVLVIVHVPCSARPGRVSMVVGSR